MENLDNGGIPPRETLGFSERTRDLWGRVWRGMLGFNTGSELYLEAKRGANDLEQFLAEQSGPDIPPPTNQG